MNPAAKWTMILGGAVTIAGPVLGLIGYFVGMIFSFDALGKSGIQNPEALSSSISVVLISTWGGIILGGIGFIVFVVGLTMWLFTKSTTEPTNI